VGPAGASKMTAVMDTTTPLDHGPWEARIAGPLPLRALWWGSPDAVAEPGRAQPTVVLLHGSATGRMSGAQSWQPGRAGPLDRYWRLICPGHGGSAPLPAEGYRTDELVRVVAIALQRLGLVAPIIVGHSLARASHSASRQARADPGSAFSSTLGLCLSSGGHGNRRTHRHHAGRCTDTRSAHRPCGGTPAARRSRRPGPCRTKARLCRRGRWASDLHA
jgi:hypothetical protein